MICITYRFVLTSLLSIKHLLLYLLPGDYFNQTNNSFDKVLSYPVVGWWGAVGRREVDDSSQHHSDQNDQRPDREHPAQQGKRHYEENVSFKGKLAHKSSNDINIYNFQIIILRVCTNNNQISKTLFFILVITLNTYTRRFEERIPNL